MEVRKKHSLKMRKAETHEAQVLSQKVGGGTLVTKESLDDHAARQANAKEQDLEKQQKAARKHKLSFQEIQEMYNLP